MTALAQTLTSLPYTQFRRSKYFYLWYDLFWLALCVTLCAALQLAGWQGVTTSWDWRLIVFIPLVAHIGILCNAYVHVATHNSFPRAINRLIGEVCGFVVLTRFASWEIVHQRHHKYSDHLELDPHPISPGRTSYGPYFMDTVLTVERQLQTMYFEMHGGRTPENVRFQRYRAVLSFVVSAIVVPITWAMILGLPFFAIVFLPAAVITLLQLIHFNWCTHNPWSPTGDHRPVNLNHGLYRIGNFIWHGIYFHANHHEKANLLNPSKLTGPKALPVIKPGDTTDHYPPRKKTKAPVMRKSS